MDLKSHIKKNKTKNNPQLINAPGRRTLRQPVPDLSGVDVEVQAPTVRREKVTIARAEQVGRRESE